MIPHLVFILSLIIGIESYAGDVSRGAIPNLDVESSLGMPKTVATAPTEAPTSNVEFWHGFFGAVMVIVVSELGDKTFFIAAILSMRHSRLAVFSGAITALSLMTILSVALGFAVTVIPRVYTHYISVLLLTIFGLRMIKEAYYMSPDEGLKEFEEVQRSLTKKELDDSLQASRDVDVEAGGSLSTMHRRVWAFFSRIFFQALTLTFVAEWGDRSQIATITLGAREDPFAVSIGAILGHSMCTLVAVLGGRIVSQKISVRTVTFIGGIVFLIFALSAVILGVEEDKKLST